MQIHCYEPRGKFARIYIAVADGQDPTATDQDAVWERIKRTHFYIDPGCEEHYWIGPDEEAEERATWFTHWSDQKAWEEMGLIAIDSHY